jgi:hypothetical protein
VKLQQNITPKAVAATSLRGFAPEVRQVICWLGATVCGTLTLTCVQAQQSDDAAELAKKLSNPVASLISVPLQYNYDKDFGANDQGSKSVLNIQPVVPFTLNEKWNLILRTIVPLANAHEVPPGSSDSGLGDVVQSFFFSPKQPVDGWILAAGPVLLYPTASAATLGGEKWGAGPTAVALRQRGPWTYGMLVNHIESFAGSRSRGGISATFAQPFVSYVTASRTTFGLNTESTYDWRSSGWAVPVNASVSQLLKVQSQILQVSLGARYWIESPGSGPEGFGFRATVTFLFPK